MAEIDDDELAEFNLSVLRRIDPQIQSLMFSGGHVSVYEFDMKTKKWDHKDVKGPMFLLKRDNAAAKYVFVVLNRLHIKTLFFAEQITPKMRVENTSNYYLYENEVDGVKAINCIWFYDTKLKDAFHEHVTQILEELTAGIDHVKEEEEEASLAPSVANIFRLASASPVPASSPVPAPSPPIPVAATNGLFGNVKIDVNALFSQAQASKPLTTAGIPLGVNDLFAQKSFTSPPVHPLMPNIALNPGSPLGAYPRGAPQLIPVSNSPPTYTPQEFMALMGATKASTQPLLPIAKLNGLPHHDQRPAHPPTVTSPPPVQLRQEMDALIASRSPSAISQPQRPAPGSATDYTSGSPALSRPTPQPLPSQPSQPQPSGPAPDLTQLLKQSLGLKPEVGGGLASPPAVIPPRSRNHAAGGPTSLYMGSSKSADQAHSHPTPVSSGPKPTAIPKSAATQATSARHASKETPAASANNGVAAQHLTKEQLRAAIMQLVQNDVFLDAIYGAYTASLNGVKR